MAEQDPGKTEQSQESGILIPNLLCCVALENLFLPLGCGTLRALTVTQGAQ